MIDLQHGDCLKVMDSIPDGSVDMVLTDPPYGTTHCDWDSVIPVDDMMRQFRRVVRPGGAILIFNQLPFTCDLIGAWKNGYRYSWVYEKTNPVGFLNAKKMPMRCYELVSVFYDRLPTYHPQMTHGKPYDQVRFPSIHARVYATYEPSSTHNTGTRYPRDVLHWATMERGLHPTQKPVDLMEYFIKTYTDPGETVLDACMGSGSTGVAALRTGRSFIGIEADEGIFLTAKNRILNEADLIPQDMEVMHERIDCRSAHAV